MKGNNISLQEKLEFFKRDGVKLRLSVALIKGAIDSKEKLLSIYNNITYRI